MMLTCMALSYCCDAIDVIIVQEEAVETLASLQETRQSLNITMLSSTHGAALMQQCISHML